MKYIQTAEVINHMQTIKDVFQDVIDDYNIERDDRTFIQLFEDPAGDSHLPDYYSYKLDYKGEIPHIPSSVFSYPAKHKFILNFLKYNIEEDGDILNAIGKSAVRLRSMGYEVRLDVFRSQCVLIIHHISE